MLKKGELFLSNILGLRQQGPYEEKESLKMSFYKKIVQRGAVYKSFIQDSEGEKVD
jgi:hypothetical protein